MCKNNKKENVETVDFMDILADVITGVVVEAIEMETDNTTNKEIGNSVDLEKEIDKVVFNEPATIVFWKDGTKTVTKCSEGDSFNKETGLAMCIIRKLCNNRHYNHVFEKFCK